VQPAAIPAHRQRVARPHHLHRRGWASTACATPRHATPRQLEALTLTEYRKEYRRRRKDLPHSTYELVAHAHAMTGHKSQGATQAWPTIVHVCSARSRSACCTSCYRASRHAGACLWCGA
jgi:hypothetical protein